MVSFHDSTCVFFGNLSATEIDWNAFFPLLHNHNRYLTFLNIIENLKLRNLLKNGPQFREQPSKTNFKKLKNDLKYQIRKFLDSWASKHKVSVEAFSEWKINVFKMLEQRIYKLQYNPRKVEPEVLKDTECLDFLNTLHSRFVFTPVDKASNNIAVICKKYYIKSVLSEVGLWPNTHSLTYTQLKESSKKEILDLQYGFSNFYNIKDNFKTSNLPFMYAIPKFHKNPIKFRYIISSSKCQTKPLAKAITKGL